MAMGAPARVVRELTSEERGFLTKSAENYVGDAREYYRYVKGPSKLGQDFSDLENFEEEGEGP
jgi:carbonic anhydrase/acetyltransferase-like protein (isoleucine patch superfamily)